MNAPEGTMRERAARGAAALVTDIEADFGPLDDGAKVALMVDLMLLGHEIDLACGPVNVERFSSQLLRNAERARDEVLLKLGRRHLELVYNDLWGRAPGSAHPVEVFDDALERSGYQWLRRRLRATPAN